MTGRAVADFAIVGAGAAGCLIAARLAHALPEARILLIEAGSKRPGLLNAIPLLSGYAPFARGVNWRHPARHAGRDTLLYQGRIFGGSSEINGMVVSRGETRDYLSWADAAGPEWSFEACLDAFRRLEHSTRGPSPLHGGDGPMAVRPIEPYGPLPHAFLAAAGEAGFPLVDDLNGAGGARFGFTDVNIKGGRRHSASRAFLPECPANLTILAGRSVERLDVVSGRVAALLLRYRGQEERIEITRECVLCAGAIGTTGILMRSGIGPAAMLGSAGITPELDHPELGGNLQNHPSYLMRVPTHGGSLRGLLRPNRAVAAGLRWLGRRDGPLAQGLFQVAGYFPAGDDEAVADAQLVLSPALFPLSAPGKPPLVPRRHGVSIAVQQGSPFSRGRVTIQASGRLAVDTGALSDPRDRAFMVSAVARVQDILSRPAFRPHIADPGVFKTVDAGEITCAIGTAYHMAGTARMGRDAQAVTDPKLRLRGLSGLRIADASVMPVIPNAALHFPTMMIAQRASDFIIADA